MQKAKCFLFTLSFLLFDILNIFADDSENTGTKYSYKDNLTKATKERFQEKRHHITSYSEKEGWIDYKCNRGISPGKSLGKKNKTKPIKQN